MEKIYNSKTKGIFAMSEQSRLPTIKALWDGTGRLIRRLKYHPEYEEPAKEGRTGTFAGRHIIARDTPINGGVYLGGAEREAIVVDDERYPKELDAAYQDLQERLENKNKGGTVLDKVNELVIEKFGGKQDEKLEREVVMAVNNTLEDHGPDAKITLNDFINFGKGICRHRSLLGGYLIERLVKDGVLGGSVSVDRSYIEGLGGHAWIRWAEHEGEVTVIDPALAYIGPPKSPWYIRPEKGRK